MTEEYGHISDAFDNLPEEELLMTEEELKVSNEFTTFVRVQLDQEQKQQLNRFLNLHYFGDVNCNEMNENGHFVSKYPEKETKDYKDAMWRAQTTFQFEVKLLYDVNGNCKLELL